MTAPRQVKTYTFNGEDVTFPLEGKSKDKLNIKITKDTIIAGFKGEPHNIIEGYFYDQVSAGDSCWTLNDGKVTINIEKKNDIGPWPFLIRPKDENNYEGMDYHSQYLYGRELVVQVIDLENGWNLVDRAAKAGHKEGILNMIWMKSSNPETFDEAKRYAKLGIEVWGEDHKFCNILGDIELEQNNEEEALMWYGKCDMDSDVDVLIKVARINIAQGIRSDDQEKIEKGIVLLGSKAETSGEASIELSKTLYDCGEYQKSLDYYQNAFKLNPKLKINSSFTLEMIQSKIPVKQKAIKLPNNDKSSTTNQEKPQKKINNQNVDELVRKSRNTEGTTSSSSFFSGWVPKLVLSAVAVTVTAAVVYFGYEYVKKKDHHEDDYHRFE
jgi:tetratricopeptide (TPR) repeat protein